VLHAKDGKTRQTSRDWARRAPGFRAALVSIAVATGVGAILAACGLAFSLRRKRPLRTDATATDTQLQQLTRYRAADGTHTIHGTLLAEFEPGDRSTTIYVGFCPPFERLPTVEVEAAGDSFATAKLSQLLHNGVQIEVRLPKSPDEKQTVTIEIVATDAPLY
jgi:hypothetical protein